MMQDMIYKAVKNHIAKYDEDNVYGYNISLHQNMNQAINNYLSDFKLIDMENINLLNPETKDLIFYLIYACKEERQARIEQLERFNEHVKYNKAQGPLGNQKDLEAIIEKYIENLKRR